MRTCPSIEEARERGRDAAIAGRKRSECPFREPGLKTVGALRYFHSRRRAWRAGFNSIPRCYLCKAPIAIPGYCGECACEDDCAPN